MILADSGALVAVFNPADAAHAACFDALGSLNAQLITTLPVLTETFCHLGPASRGSANLRDLVARREMDVWDLGYPDLMRAFELMEVFADHPMDLADASLIAAAEALGIMQIFTLDRRGFGTYRIRRGHRYYPVEILPRR
jgi:uncharacterized protein